ncbi:hypothetical protein [Luteibacter sp. ME-Dv--P-043b]|uniref:hypothetical protein n=1 Tax=Luteibacter sp. ME-Dv--P-043b TaxID=3040291 RepID=UPI0025523CE0|nr:hypothetical protein [Luteibacter sp. ME-Dv--P-043b]
MEETRTVNAADIELIHANISKMMAETMKLSAETSKVSAETSKIQAEQRYYPIVAFGAIIVGALGAGAAIIAALIKLTL